MKYKKLTRMEAKKFVGRSFKHKDFGPSEIPTVHHIAEIKFEGIVTTKLLYFSFEELLDYRWFDNHLTCGINEKGEE